MQVRALTTIFHEGQLLKAGDIFEYADEAAKALTGHISEGIEAVTKKSTAAFAKAQAEVQKAREDTAAALHARCEALKAELAINPGRGDLVQQVLDAEAAAAEAVKAAAAGLESLV